MTFYDFCFVAFGAILFLHYIYLFVDDDSKFKKSRLRKAIEQVYKHIVHMNEYTNDGVKFHEVKVIHKNKEFTIGIFKKEHSNRYTTYEIFINGDEAGTFHILGDCCSYSYYFETQNNRYKSEVMDIVRAGAKEAKRQAKTTIEKKGSWNEYSYFK